MVWRDHQRQRAPPDDVQHRDEGGHTAITATRGSVHGPPGVPLVLVTVTAAGLLTGRRGWSCSRATAT